jgi:predicted PurR-regulated permease PerM
VIVVPVIVASIIAAVASPLVRWLEKKRIARGLGTSLVLLGLVLVSLGMGFALVSGVVSEASSIGDQLEAALKEIGDGLESLGIAQPQADDVRQKLSSGADTSVSALLNGIVTGVGQLSSIVFFLAMTFLSLFFLLKDGPSIRAWAEGHSGLPGPVAKVVSQRSISALRGYFVGVTIVAAFTAVVVGVGSVVIGLPYIAAIVSITFVAGYVPYVGAWTAGAFTVLLALGAEGPEAAIAMAMLQLLANGLLQQMIQPVAMGAALGIHPLAVLVVTIAGGALFGAIGLIIAAPVVAAGVKVAADVAAAKRQAASEREAGAEAAAPGPGRALS